MPRIVVTETCAKPGYSSCPPYFLGAHFTDVVVVQVDVEHTAPDIAALGVSSRPPKFRPITVKRAELSVPVDGAFTRMAVSTAASKVYLGSEDCTPPAMTTWIATPGPAPLAGVFGCWHTSEETVLHDEVKHWMPASLIVGVGSGEKLVPVTVMLLPLVTGEFRDSSSKPPMYRPW